MSGEDTAVRPIGCSYRVLARTILSYRPRHSSGKLRTFHRAYLVDDETRTDVVIFVVLANAAFDGRVASFDPAPIPFDAGSPRRRFVPPVEARENGERFDAEVVARPLGVLTHYRVQVNHLGTRKEPFHFVDGAHGREPTGQALEGGRLVPARVQLRTRNLTALKAYVVQRAKGHCQLCGCEAPFKDKNGDPYLEIHHAVPIRDGGSDSAENLIALCPNCHRKIHVSADPNDMKKLHRIAASYSAHD